jgi:outer membrane protein OmpA-like peptidoglycan-associated protein
MSRRWTALFWLGVAMAIVVGAAVVEAPRISSGLGERSRGALTARGVSGVDVRFSGRDATLAGPGVSDAVVALVAAQPGVRRVVVLASAPIPAPAVPRGSEDLPASQVAQRIVNLLGTDGLRYEAGGSVLGARARGVVADIGALLAAHTEIRVQVAGHSDGSAPDGGAGVGLSRQRAAGVADLLAAAGVARGAIVVVGFGPGQPAGDPATAVGRALNRRVEIIVLGG